jgi:RNA polymerase sigma-70 factor (ECF subfamily)
MDNLSDEKVALLVQNGDTESCGFLVERHESKIARYAKKFIYDKDDIADLVQNVFIKAYVNMQSFDTGKRFSPWIYRIAHNEFINAIKKKKREPLNFFDPDTIFPHPIARETADSRAQEKDLKKTFDACLDKVPAKYREPIVLRYYEELDYKEIADILHIPVSTVGVRISRGKSMLKKIYEDLNK